MQLTIPKPYRDGFRSLLGYPPAKVEDLLAFFAKADVAASLVNLSKTAAEAVGLDEEELADVLYAVASLRSLLENTAVTPDDLLQQLKTAIEKDLGEDLEEPLETWETAEAFLREMLQEGSVLTISSKAAWLREEAERRYCRARIVSDLRPVFRSGQEPPEAALIQHQLRLTFHAIDFETEDFFLLMRRPHLLKLRHAVDRALRKDEQLRELVNKAGLTLLEDEDEEV